MLMVKAGKLDGRAEGVRDWLLRVSGCLLLACSPSTVHLTRSESMVSPFDAGRFQNESEVFRITAEALVKLSASDLAKHLQVTDDNPMDGLEGRAGLLSALGKALLAKPEFYKSGRPGDMLGTSLSRRKEGSNELS